MKSPAFYEWYWSKESAQRAADKLERAHPGLYKTRVRIARRADLSHDWVMEAYAIEVN